MLNAAFAAAVLLLQAAAVAPPPAAAPSTAASPAPVSPVTVRAPNKAAVEESRVVCRKQQVLGTLFPKEVCATKREFAERQREDRIELERDTALRPYDINSGLPTPQ